MLISTLKIISNIAGMNDTGKNNHQGLIFSCRHGLYSTLSGAFKMIQKAELRSIHACSDLEREEKI